MRAVCTGGVALALALVSWAAGAQVAWPTQGWQVTAPEAQGMDSRALQSLVEFGAHNQMDSLVLARNGKIVLETYYAPFQGGTRHVINSATKGVVAGLVGIAIGKGLLRGADVPVLELLPDAAPPAPDERKRAITLQHLLDMTSGLDWKEPLSAQRPETLIQMQRSPDWARFILQQPMAQAPGAAFSYNSGNSHLASAILARAAGMSTEAFAAEHLFKPLGIIDWRWRKDPQGVSFGGYGLYLQPRDMAKIGHLYLHRGQWDGRQVIPQAWVDKVFKASLPMSPSGGGYRYGDSWWVVPTHGAYIATGFHRQLIVVLPRLGVVVATNGRTHYPLEQLLDQVAAAVKSPQALAPNPPAAQALAARVQAAGRELADTPVPASAQARSVSGKTWRFAPNDFGLKEFKLLLADAPSYEVVSYVERNSPATRSVVYPLGLQGRFMRGDNAGAPVLSKAAWMDDKTLSVQARMLEDGETATYLLRFDGKKVAVDFRHSLGFGARLEAEAAD